MTLRERSNVIKEAETLIKPGNLPQGETAMPRIRRINMSTNRKRQDYRIEYFARNGFWSQTIQLYWESDQMWGVMNTVQIGTNVIEIQRSSYFK